MQVRSAVLRISRIVVVAVILFLLVEFPRGKLVQGGQATTPMHTFTWRQFGHHISQQIRAWMSGSAGTSVESAHPIAEVLRHVPLSLELLLISFAVTIFAGTAKGLYDGLHTERQSFFATVSRGTHWAAESIPDFAWIVGLVALSFWLDQHNIQVFFVGSQNFWTGTLVPALVLALIPTMYVAREVKNTVDSQLRQVYLTTATAKGLRRHRILFKHLLPNCYGTLAATLAPIAGMLLSGLVVVEFMFYRQGIMYGWFEAMGNTGDAPVFTPVSIQPTANPVISYYNLDPVLCLYYLIVAALLFALLWLLGRSLLWVVGFRGQANPATNALRDDGTQRLPWGLMTGTLMLAITVLCGVFAAHLHLPSPTAQDMIHFGPGNQVTIPPFPPSARHPLGTDATGHDLLSLAVYGILPTLGLMTVSAIGITLVSGSLAWVSSVLRVKTCRFVVDTWHGIFTVIPGVAGALLIMYIPQLYWAGIRFKPDLWTWSQVHAWIFFALLAAVECGRVAARLIFRLDDELSKDYMEAAVVSGGSPLQIFWTHLRRPMAAMLIETVVFECVRVLTLIAVFGYFQISVGGAWVYTEPPFPATWHFSESFSNWGALLGANAHSFLASPWVFFAPTLFITWTAIALNLIANGVQGRLQRVPR